MRRMILLLAALAAAAVFSVQAQQSRAASPPSKPAVSSEPLIIEGVVRDFRGQGLPGAVVMATSRNTATTGKDGSYRITGLDRAQPTYLMHVQKPGYLFVPDRVSVHPPSRGILTANFTATDPKAK
ncbi:carboxypeptidase-like regulatory domain-containing protein [Paludibaculum fermentans]|uniref:carboxypeptidase-like regulatory domain-containing protein n=1 Tax=Paludibaculum fermentans TaxID=1473598 RepID=UPI003EBF74BE